MEKYREKTIEGEGKEREGKKERDRKGRKGMVKSRNKK